MYLDQRSNSLVSLPFAFEIFDNLDQVFLILLNTKISVSWLMLPANWRQVLLRINSVEENNLPFWPLALPFAGPITWLILSRFTARGLVSSGLTQQFPGIVSTVRLELPIYHLNGLPPPSRGVWAAVITLQCRWSYLTWTMVVLLLAAPYVGRITMWSRAERSTLTSAFHNISRWLPSA